MNTDTIQSGTNTEVSLTQKPITTNNKDDTKLEKLEEEQIYKTWKYTRGLSNRTLQSYKHVIQHYKKATNMTLTELHDEALNEEDQQIPMHRRRTKLHLIEYQEYLDQQTWTDSTKRLHMFVVNSFYQSLEVQVPHVRNKYDDSPQPANVEKAINKEIIQLMMQQATTKEKAILSFAATTGQSPDEIRRLTIEDIMKAWNTKLKTPLFDIPDIFRQRQQIASLENCTLRIQRHKTKNNYWVYLANETTRHILDHLYERVAGNNPHIRIHSKTDPLFTNKQGQFYSNSGINKVFTVVGKRCGFESPELYPEHLRVLLEREPGQQRTWSAYKFRKYFLNNCRRYAGTTSETGSVHQYTGEELGDFWIGHQKKGSISHYLQYTDEDVQELCTHYAQVLPYLSLEMEVKTLSSEDREEFLEMKKNYEQVLTEMAELKEYVEQRERVHRLAEEYGIEIKQ